MDNSCCTDPGAKQSYQSQGREEEIAGVNTYKTGQGKSAIVLFTDVFGYSYVNNRKVADRFAEETGATVIVPDCFHGDPIDPNIPNYRDLFPDWFKKHPITDACNGFCYGAKLVVYLISHPELSSTIKAAIVGHPAFLVEEEAAQIKRPILFLCAETDFTFARELQDHFEKELTSSNLGTFITYPGTIHGFVTRPDGSQQSNQQSEKAIQDAAEYFKKNI